MSHGERIIYSLLNLSKTDFKWQYKFNDCKCKGELVFDFYIPKYNTVIEYDGDQHKIPIEHFGGEKQFEQQKAHDTIKDAYAQEKGLNMLRITEKNPDKIAAILSESLGINIAL